MKPQQSWVSRSLHFLRKYSLQKSPEVCPPVGWGEKATHQPVGFPLSLNHRAQPRQVWERTHNSARILLLDRRKHKFRCHPRVCFPVETQWLLADPNYHYPVSAKVCFLIIPQKLHGQQVTLFLGLTPQTCPKNALHAKSYCFPGWPPTSFPKKATTLASFLKLHSPPKNS